MPSAMFYLEDYAKVDLEDDGFYLTPSETFFKNWYDVLELYSTCDLCEPVQFKIIDGCDKEVLEKMMSKMSYAVNDLVEKNGYLFFNVSESSLKEIYSEVGIDNFNLKPIQIKFVKINKPGWEENVKLFNNFVFDNVTVNKVANRFKLNERFISRFNI